MYAKEAKQLRGDSKSQNEQNVLEISTAVGSVSDSGPCDSTVNLQEEQPGQSNLKSQNELQCKRWTKEKGNYKAECCKEKNENFNIYSGKAE